MFNNGFMSAVQHRENPDMLVVRARRREVLELYFPGTEVIVSDQSDYRYRVFVEKQELGVLMMTMALNITYTNFKQSTTDPELSSLYGKIWSLHQAYQR